jgi:diguanylate cyclase (GGDEF)-like protein
LLRLRLRSKLLLGVFTVVCAAMAVQFVILSDRVGNDLEALERQRVDEDLTVAVNALEQLNTRLERAAAGASVDRALAAAVVRGDGRWVAANVLSHVLLNERVQSAVVLTSDGRLLRSAGLPLPDVRMEPVVQATAAGVVSSRTVYRDGRLWVLAAAPVVSRSYDEEPVGSLVLGVVVSDSFAKSLRSVTGTEITFVADGVVMGTTDRRLAGELLQADEFAVLERQAVPLVSAGTASKARALLTAGATTLLIVSNDRAPMVTANAAMRRSILISLWPGLVLAAIVAVLLSVQLGRPLSRLTRAVDAMAFGDLSTRVTPRGDDEFADLGHAFNAMARRVEEAQETLWRAAVRDSLTGLLNHREFYRRLEEEVARADRDGQELSVLMLDLDDFKSINDTCGHLRGDTVLREMARALETCVREQDVLARYAGDEFAVVLTATGERAARSVAERVRRCAAAIAVDSAVAPAGGVTVSIGVATRAPGVEPLGDLMERADQALYRAKAEGRDRVVVAATVCS